MRHKKLSVVMSAYNRGLLLQRSLFTLINQELLPDEIIIIDDGSSDSTSRIVELFKRYAPRQIDIRYFYNNNPKWTICVHGMNCGIKKASHEIVMLTEPEVLHASEDIELTLKHFENPKNEDTILIANPVYAVYRDAMQKLKEHHYRDPTSIIRLPIVHEWYNGYESPQDTITYFPKGGTHFIACILKKHLMAIGGYDEKFLDGGAGGYDDIDLLTRLRLYGIREARNDDIIAIHLYHGLLPEYARNPELLKKNEQILKSRKEGDWEVNKGKKWGILKR